MESVLVLLSTYNGEKYLEEQLQSIVEQNDVQVRILVRDDGSSDSTTAILDEWQSKGLLQWYSGDNLGPARSFMNLIEHAGEADFYALCDQDDVWLPDKLARAASMLKNTSSPALYFSQTQMVDVDLNPIATPVIRPRCTMGEAMLAFYATGCTFVFNRDLRTELLKRHCDMMPMHDIWIYRVCLAVRGKVYFDPVSHILYRQHSMNVIGLDHSISQKWHRRLSGVARGKHERSKIAELLLNRYGDEMTEEDRKLVEMMVKAKEDVWTRVKLIFNKELRCGSWRTDITSRISILFGWY